MLIWEKNGRFIDGMRPGVEPDGLDTPEQVVASAATTWPVCARSSPSCRSSFSLWN